MTKATTQAPQDINMEKFKFERALRIADCKKELFDSGPLDLLKFIFESRLREKLPNIVIML